MVVTRQSALARTLLLTRQFRLPDVEDGALLRAFSQTAVCIVADGRNLASAASQAAVTTLAGLVVACGMRVRLVMPPTPIIGYQPPILGEDLVTGICDLAGDSVPGGEGGTSKSSAEDDLVFVIGDSEWRGPARRAWRLGADPWCGFIMPVGEHVGPISGDFPIGALAAATVAAAEPYRHALSEVVETTDCAVPEPWQLASPKAAKLQLADPRTPTTSFAIGSLDMVSGGALTTAALHVLLRVKNLPLSVWVWEPQFLDPTNLNRYALMRRSMLSTATSKVQMLQRWQGPISQVVGHTVTFDRTVVECTTLSPWVFVGTDNVETRWLVQGAWPQHLVVAGTAGFMAVSSEHDASRACAGCYHAWTEEVAGEVPTVSFVSYLGGLMAAARILRWAAAGASPAHQQASEAWADRLDSEFGFRNLSIPRLSSCPVGCPRDPIN